MALEEPEVRAGRNVEGLAAAPLSQHKPPHENAADQQHEQHDGDHTDHVEQIPQIPHLTWLGAAWCAFRGCPGVDQG